ncbi:MAG: ABC transporter ATP-binding protein [Propionicimonas sp.]|uniref:ABC transporter ATP-binding protein n=1 Tax=Propionicimonas sp. TaxID=1955623 RepID=UPI002B1F09C0|nr:ABC transporter ATP-binding protein [Propionicimonas sp.]MEA4943857.1 ABC transporter ATP-binding protein [Propionicimonas sp.]MEA5053060.1 ABC transporter ATP-binding protein [Propionicimonas sp.]MEA5117634.1 ABC transporter ATP-binding protein [Propionicimonas sp.]
MTSTDSDDGGGRRPGPALRTDALSVGYDGRPLIEDIAVNLAPGTVLALIGPNGSGKTTILKTIARYLATIAGTVYIDEHAITDLTNRDLARRLAVVLTERLKTELMTCQDVVATGRYPHTGRFGILGKADREVVRSSMELLHAWELRDQDFRHLSDGQRQRVLIARALAQEPQVIVLDEPTAYLDVRYKLELLAILRELAKQRGITVVMSLHELDMAQKVADLVMCVQGDHVTSIGSPHEIFTAGRIDEIFELDHGSYDPLFGSLEFAPAPGEPEVFVIAGGGRGVASYRALQRRAIPFATGVLHRNDVDFHVGSRLASEIFAEEAFEPISQAVYDQALARLLRCRAVVNRLDGYGSANVLNRTLAEQAEQHGLPVVTSVHALRPATR